MANPVTHLEKTIAGEVSPVTHLEHVIAEYGGGNVYESLEAGTNILIEETADGKAKISASGEVSSEDTVARADIAAIKDGETLDSFGDVETALGDKQNTISDLATIRSGAALGATAVQPETGKGLSTNDYTTAEKTKLAGIEAQANKTTVDNALSGSSTNPVQNKVVKLALDSKANASTTYTKTEVDTALSGKQNAIDSSHKLSADLVDDTSTTNKFATASELEQISTNKNNILTLESKNGSKNYLNYDKTILQSLNTGGSWADNVWTIGNGVTLTVNADNSITLNGTSTAGKTIYLAKNSNITSDTYILSMTTPLISKLWAGISAVGGGEYNFTAPNSYISQSCQPNNITVYIDNGCVLDNITLYPMLCDDESWSLSHNYQQYAMSNAEITAWIKAHT